MKIGVCSDIHSNLEALEAVLDDASHQGVTHCLCVGDQVGYNADPHACMERLRALPRLLCCVQGNHDYYAANQEELLQFNPIAKQAACWTREHLSLEDRQELARLPLVAHVPLPGPLGGLQVVHASLFQPEEWPYLVDTMSVLNCFRMLQADLCFLGHSHVPLAIVLRENGLEVRDCPEFSLKAGERYLINPGSVGQPRDNDPRAAYGILDVDAGHYQLRRVEYDLPLAQEKIRRAGLPERCAQRLALGQ